MQTWAGRLAAKLPHDQGKERLVLRLAVLGMPVGMLAGALGSAFPGVGALFAAGILAVEVLVVIYVRRLPRLLISGTLGGGVAGFIALGGGSRLAMRVVALLGGRREVTVDGTVFLLIAGTMLGAVIGVSIAAALRVWPHSGRTIGLLVAATLFGLLISDGEAFDELLHDGPGGWLNFPMFAAFLLAYGWLAPRLVRWIEGRLPHWTPRFARPAPPVVESVHADSGATRL